MNKELQNPYFLSARRWGIGFGLCLLVAVGGRMLGLLPILPSILIGAVGGTGCLIFWLALWLTAHSLEGELEAFRQGKAIDQWPLTADETLRWWEDRRRGVTLGALVVGAMVLLIGAVLGLIIWNDAHKPELGASILGGAILAAGAVTLTVRWVLSGPKPQGKNSYTLWIGPDLAVLAGHVTRWQGPGLRLDRAEGLDDPPRLRVNFRAAIKNGWADQQAEFPAPSVSVAAAVAASLEAGRRD